METKIEELKNEVRNLVELISKSERKDVLIEFENQIKELYFKSLSVST